MQKNYQKNFTNGKRQRQLLFRNHPSLKGKAGSVEIKRETLFGPQSCLLQDCWEKLFLLEKFRHTLPRPCRVDIL